MNMNQPRSRIKYSIIIHLIFYLPNGIYLECKGYWEAQDRRKIKAVKQLHPEIDLRMVFQSPFNKISKKSEFPKTTYAQYNVVR